jgi:hypothetical protein
VYTKEINMMQIGGPPETLAETARNPRERVSCVLPGEERPCAYLYVMAADNGEVKVGYSGSPFARLSAVKAAYAERRGFKNLSLFAYVQSAAPILDELLVIRRLLPLATGGEWFRCTPEHALRIVIETVWEGDGLVRVFRPRKNGGRWLDDIEWVSPLAA